MPTHDKDTTKTWVRTLANLQPKQGEVGKIADGAQSAGLKAGVVQKKPAVRKIMTIRDGSPCWIHFDEDGKEVQVEKVPGH